MKTCMICESKENVIDLFGYFEHETFSICKTCARLASTLANGDLLNFHRQTVKAEHRHPKKHTALAAPDHAAGDDTPEYNPDCPACLRGRDHTISEHEHILSRNYAASIGD